MSPSCPHHLDLFFSPPLSDSLCCLSVNTHVSCYCPPPPNTTTTPHHLLPFIPHSVTHPSTSPPPPSLFSVSVEPLWLHRYTDCWLCRGGGMLFWHSTRRYCTSSTLPLSHNLCTNRPPVLDQILRPVCFPKGTHYACLYFFTYIICLICELLNVSITITVTEDQWQICT